MLPNGQVLVAGGASQSAGNALASCELYNPATGTWTVTGSLNASRTGHTATLLPNGQVLVAGGTTVGFYSNPLASCELYNPATGEWTYTGSLNTLRCNHTATLLPSGLALVAGGVNNANGGGNQGPFGNALVSAELYDPISGAWTLATGSMTDGRYYQTEVLLPDGQVLAAGGMNSYNPIDSCELYNPSTEKWSLTGSMNYLHEGHTTTLLPTGEALVADYGEELYNPSNGTWSVTGSLNTERDAHTATLLPNGQVLVAGGTGEGPTYLTSAELYDPTTATWTYTGSLNTARYSHTATLLPGGLVLMVGGLGSDGNALASCELFNPANGYWTDTGSLNTGRDFATATLLPSETNAAMLVAGGYTGGQSNIILASAELYSPDTGTWTYTGSMNTARFSHTATLLADGDALVAGGYAYTEGDNSDASVSAELYDPSIGTWTLTGSMNYARYYHTATLLTNGQVLVAGGSSSSSDPASAELYNPSTGAWTLTGSLNAARFWHTATLLPNGEILVTGGLSSNGIALASAELYNPSTGAWSLTGSLNTARIWHTATLLPNGQVLVAGGADINYNPLDSCELYNPLTGTWSFTIRMTDARDYQTANLLPNGQVLITGGRNSGGDIVSAELYEPGLGTWTLTDSLNVARGPFTATLLPNGEVLAAAGSGSSGGATALASAELYNVGLDFSESWQPLIGTVPSLFFDGASLALTGAGFEGVSEGSGGNTQTSPANYPVVQLRSLGNEQTLFLPSTGWSGGSFSSAPVSGLPPGYAFVTVFVNGVPSQSSFLNVALPLQSYVVSAKINKGSFQFNFNYTSGVDFSVLTTTNLALSLSKWTLLGSATEVSPGQYQFTDVLATNSPQRFYRLRAQAGAIYVGNSLSVPNPGVDGVPPLVILGEYSTAGPLATSSTTLPTGTVQDVKFYGKNYNFTLYALSLVGSGPNANEQTFQVVASEHFSGSASTASIQTLAVSGFSVSAGDFLAFAGTGPYYSQNSDDAMNSAATYENSSDPNSSTATPPGGPGTQFTVGINPDPSAIYEYVSDYFGNQGRNYGIGVDVSP